MQFQSSKDKEAVKIVETLKYNDHNIIVLLALPPETLTKRKMLKPIIDQQNKNVRFQWSPTLNVIVVKNEAQYRAEDVPSSKTLLEALELPLPPS